MIEETLEQTKPLNDLIAERLITKATDGEDKSASAEKPPSDVSKAEFIKIEKNLASLGFFTPSSKRVRNEKAKTISFTRVVDGQRVKVRATIVPAAWTACRSLLIKINISRSRRLSMTSKGECER